MHRFSKWLVLFTLAYPFQAGAQSFLQMDLQDHLVHDIQNNGFLGSVDADASHLVQLLQADHNYLRNGVDTARVTYRIVGQASADSAPLSGSDGAKVFGTVDLLFTLPNVALWDISAMSQFTWTAAAGTQTSAVNILPFLVGGTGPAAGLSSALPGINVPFGSNIESNPSAGPTTTQVLNALGGSGTVSAALDMRAGSGGGEAIAFLGQRSGLSPFGLDDDFAPRSAQVTIVFRPHLNFSGQTLAADIALEAGERVNGFGAIAGSVSAPAGATVSAAGGRLELGTAASQVSLQGDQHIGSGGTLALRDADAALIAGNTTLAGGALEVVGPTAAKLEGQLSGFGKVHGPLQNNGFVSALGGQIELTGEVSGVGGYAGDILLSGLFRPGRSPTFVTFQDGMTLASSATLEIELGGLLPGFEHDAIDVLGTARLDGALTVALIDGFGLDFGQTFDILRAGELDGMFDGLAEGGLVGNFGGFDLFITYAAGDGNDVMLFTDAVAAIPEPGTYAMLLAGF